MDFKNVFDVINKYNELVEQFKKDCDELYLSQFTEEEKSKLDKIFQRCYNNFLESENQLKYRNELKNKKEVHRT